MTARYATIKDQTLRREWERFRQRVKVRGELIPLEPEGSVMSDAAWALENLARAKQTLANGYCGLPLQQTCPHPNACLTCDSFLTTVEFLPQHRDQLTRTEQLIAQAQADGRQRLVDMNEPVRLNLVRSSTDSRPWRTPVSAEPLGQAAAARHDRAIKRAQDAPRDLDREGAQVSFQAVARRAEVSRQWLYTQPELRSQIERLRDRRPSQSDGVPGRQRASEASLRQRVEALRAENRRLREENASLKDELAIAYGQQRAAAR
jgi:Family of unknown function (DUF6262)